MQTLARYSVEEIMPLIGFDMPHVKFIDGGKEYRKRIGENWLDTSIIRDDVYER